jgi:hypothetical protein
LRPNACGTTALRESDNFKYYEYILLYVDDACVVSHEPKEAMRRIDKYFPMKPGSIGEPDIDLGAKLTKVRLPNGVTAWTASASKYVQEAVKNVESHLLTEYNGRKLPRKANTLFQRDYRPELDTSPELDPKTATYYQSQIGVLRWAVELGRINIMTEVSMLSAHLALPRDGHLEAIYIIYAYLKI